MTDFRSSCKSLAQDLLSIEVNTILKDNVTAEKMPKLPLALAQIANAYGEFMEVLGVKIDPEKMTKGVSRFRTLAETAETLQSAGSGVSDSDRVVLIRIKKNSQYLANLVESVPSPQQNLFNRSASDLEMEQETNLQIDLPMENLVRVRKIWEMGVARIVAQTSIQLDGDVVTKVQRNYATPEHRFLFEIHHQGLNVALEYWQTLIDILQKIAGNLFSSFFPKGKP